MSCSIKLHASAEHLKKQYSTKRNYITNFFFEINKQTCKQHNSHILNNYTYILIYTYTYTIYTYLHSTASNKENENPRQYRKKHTSITSIFEVHQISTLSVSLVH